jgi:hypothetical protein
MLHFIHKLRYLHTTLFPSQKYAKCIYMKEILSVCPSEYFVSETTELILIKFGIEVSTLKVGIIYFVSTLIAQYSIN